MGRRLRIFALAFLTCWIFGACVEWSALRPLKPAAIPSTSRAEQTKDGVVVLSEMRQSKTRYRVKVEIRNDTKKTIRGPEGFVLEDGNGTRLPVVDLDILKSEIKHRAEGRASFSMFEGGWWRQQVKLDQIAAEAQRDTRALEADYLHHQDIPPNGTLTGFVPFMKTAGSGHSRGPFRFSIKVGQRTFDFQFSP